MASFGRHLIELLMHLQHIHCRRQRRIKTKRWNRNHNGERLLSNATRTWTYTRSDTTSNLKSCRIFRNYLKARKQGSIWTQAEKRQTSYLLMWHDAWQDEWKGLLNRIVASDEKMIYYCNLKNRKSWGLHDYTSAAKPNIPGEKLY